MDSVFSEAVAEIREQTFKLLTKLLISKQSYCRRIGEVHYSKLLWVPEATF